MPIGFGPSPRADALSPGPLPVPPSSPANEPYPVVRIGSPDGSLISPELLPTYKRVLMTLELFGLVVGLGALVMTIVTAAVLNSGLAIAAATLQAGKVSIEQYVHRLRKRIHRSE